MGDTKLNVGIGVTATPPDLSALDKGFAASLKKFESDFQKVVSGLSPSTAKGMPGTASVQAATQTNRALDQRSKEERAGIELINKELLRRKAIVEDIAKKQQAAIQGSREELAITQSLNRERERLQQTEKISNIQRETHRKNEDNANRVRGGSQPPGAPPGSTEPTGDSSGIAKGISFTAIVGGVLGAVVKTIGQISGSESRSLVAGGSAVRSTIGRETSSIYNGSLPGEIAFMGEKKKAKEMADKQEAAYREQDFAMSVGGSVAALEAAALIGTGAGAPAAIIPGAMAYGALFGSDRMKAKTMSGITSGFFPDYSKGQNQEYENLLAKQNSEDYNKNLQASRDLSPLKPLASDEFFQNAERNLNFQRQTGLNMKSFRGSYLDSIHGAGFTADQGIGMSSSILGAGGSTDASINSSALALQAQRSLDMTNAGGVMGKLSGSIGDSKISNDVFIKLLAEGTKVGLDGSNFREENRRFVESAAQAIAQSGATSSGGADQILSQFGRFFGGDKTVAGIEAGKGAYDLYQRTSMESSGPRASLRAANMLLDPTLNSMNYVSKESLFDIPENQLTIDNPAMWSAAASARKGTTPQDIIRQQKMAMAKSANQFGGSDIATAALRAFNKKHGVTSLDDVTLSPEDRMAGRRLLGTSNSWQVKEHEELKTDFRLQTAMSQGLANGDMPGIKKTLEDAEKARLNNKDTGRPEDNVNTIRSEMSREVNKIFLDMKDAIVPTVKTADDFIEKIRDLNAAMAALPPELRGKFAKDQLLPLLTPATSTPASTPPESGAPNPGQTPNPTPGH